MFYKLHNNLSQVWNDLLIVSILSSFSTKTEIKGSFLKDTITSSILTKTEIKGSLLKENANVECYILSENMEDREIT